MSDSNLYRVVDGEPVISTAGMALLMGIPPEAIRAAWDEAAQAGRMTLRPEWIQGGNRRRKECAAALGYEPTLQESLDYWAAKA